MIAALLAFVRFMMVVLVIYIMVFIIICAFLLRGIVLLGWRLASIAFMMVVVVVG